MVKHAEKFRARNFIDEHYQELLESQKTSQKLVGMYRDQSESLKLEISQQRETIAEAAKKLDQWKKWNNELSERNTQLTNERASLIGAMQAVKQQADQASERYTQERGIFLTSRYSLFPSSLFNAL
jgi:ABC-type transporter Mla subunit MlaD